MPWIRIEKNGDLEKQRKMKWVNLTWLLGDASSSIPTQAKDVDMDIKYSTKIQAKRDEKMQNWDYWGSMGTL